MTGHNDFSTDFQSNCSVSNGFGNEIFELANEGFQTKALIQSHFDVFHCCDVAA